MVKLKHITSASLRDPEFVAKVKKFALSDDWPVHPHKLVLILSNRRPNIRTIPLLTAITHIDARQIGPIELTEFESDPARLIRYLQEYARSVSCIVLENADPALGEALAQQMTIPIIDTVVAREIFAQNQDHTEHAHLMRIYIKLLHHALG